MWTQDTCEEPMLEGPEWSQKQEKIYKQELGKDSAHSLPSLPSLSSVRNQKGKSKNNPKYFPEALATKATQMHPCSTWTAAGNRGYLPPPGTIGEQSVKP